MMRTSVLTAVACAVAMVTGQNATRAEDMAPMDMAASTTAPDKAFAAAMDKMMKDMNAKPSGHPDKDFVTMMIPHHQGAIDMAKVELQYGKDPMLRTLAADVVTAQEREIAEMKAWLAKHDR